MVNDVNCLVDDINKVMVSWWLTVVVQDISSEWISLGKSYDQPIVGYFPPITLWYSNIAMDNSSIIAGFLEFLYVVIFHCSVRLPECSHYESLWSLGSSLAIPEGPMTSDGSPVNHLSNC